MSADRQALIALAHCAEPGDAALGRLVAERGATAVLAMVAAGTSGLAHGEGLAARLAASAATSADAAAERIGARIVTRCDREWPTQLDALSHHVPLALWVSGAADLRLLALRCVAIVGARACTVYGEEIARSWAADLAADRWCIVSGGAYGIDAAAHRGALAAGGATICVLAGGVDVPYPRGHDALISRVVDDGLVLSEVPVGEGVRRQRFLSRNRLIAALSRATVVVEAAERSGTTATARVAAELNRPVLAVPGPVNSVASTGCHRMIRDGRALLVSSACEVAELIDLTSSARRSDIPTQGADPDRAVWDSLGSRERRVLDALPARAPADLGMIVLRCGIDGRGVLAALGLLESRGLVQPAGDGWRRGRR